MPKTQPLFECSHCGAQYRKWQGRCAECGKWNTIEEVSTASSVSATSLPHEKPLSVKTFRDVAIADASRTKTTIEELDTVLGGGLVAGSIVLLGGDPGIGKSTLALQVACHLQNARKRVLYISAEESESQVKIRAERLSVPCEDLAILHASNLDAIVATVKQEHPDLVILDSVQTVASPSLPSVAGSATQVRFVAEQFLNLAKTLSISTILIGHVTKEGVVAGPKTLEHLVDVVLYLEGDRYGSFRILRGVKNRFGSTGEVGIFEMARSGLKEVKNPSQIFLAEGKSPEPGTAVYVTLEGRRAFLGVVQALVTHTNFGYPRRTASGFDLNRLQLLVAVLTKRAGLSLDDQDIYIKTVGGLKIDDPALDLPVCLAIASSLKDKKIDSQLVSLGEVGLSGEIHTAQHLRERLREIERLGFKKVLLAEKDELKNLKSTVDVMQVQNIQDALRRAMT